MPKIVYGVGLLVGDQLKVIGLTTQPLSGPPSKPLDRLRLQLDEFNKDTMEAQACVGVPGKMYEKAKISYFSGPADVVCGHAWLASSKVQMVKIYENSEAEELAA